GALVAVPAEERLDDGELGVGVGAEPAGEEGEGVAGVLDDLAGVEFVFGESEAADADGAGLAGVLPIAGAAQDGEVAGVAGDEVDLAEAAGQVLFGPDGGGGGDLLGGGHGQAHAVEAGLVEEGLVPGDVGGGLPALVVV